MLIYLFSLIKSIPCKISFVFLYTKADEIVVNKTLRVATHMPPPISSAVALRRADATLRSFPHAEYVPTLTVAAALRHKLRVKAALSKAAW